MLNELHDEQKSDETVRNISLTFDVETRSSSENEIVHRKYTFSYAKEWDQWTFHEFEEKKTPDTTRMTDRSWSTSRHIFWQDFSETPSIDVPKEVADQLAEAIGADSVTIQTPHGSSVEYNA